MNKETEKSNKADYNRFGFYFFVGTLVFSALWASYFLIVSNKVDLGEYSGQTEKSPIEGALSPKEKDRPWISTEALVAYGSKVYQAQCALCHGDKGLGDGTPGLIPPPRNLVEGKWKEGGSSKALFITLQKGIEGSSMVSFKRLPQLDRWAVVHYIRSITQNKVVDDEKELEKFAKQAL